VPEADDPKTARILERIATIRKRLLAVDLVCPGTISRRMRRCGKPCRCATDPKALHGPYYEWTHIEKSRFRNERLSAKAAQRYAKAIANMRLARRLLKQWERESRRILDQPD
jgi:hypothetical protein